VRSLSSCVAGAAHRKVEQGATPKEALKELGDFVYAIARDF